MRVVAWKAWYVGGAAFCSTEVEWSELPDDGMLGYVILFDQLGPDGKHLHRISTGRDWYWKSDGMKEDPIYGYSDDEPAEILARYPSASLKRGKWTDDPEMYRVSAEMQGWDV